MTPGVDLWSWKAVDDRLQGLKDWQLILALHQEGHDGLITCDEKMLESGQALMVAQQTFFHLVICTRTGDDSVAATGMLLFHLPSVVREWHELRAQVWRLKCTETQVETWKRLDETLHTKKGVRMGQFKLTRAQLDRRVLPRRQL